MSIALSQKVSNFIPLSVPVSESDRYIFVRIRGGFHEIRSSVSASYSKASNSTQIILYFSFALNDYPFVDL